MNALEDIKEALEGVTHAPGKWEAEGTAVYCDDTTGQRVCDTKGEYLFWSEDQKRNAAVYIAAANPVAISELLSTLEILQRENEESLAENGDLRNIVSNCAAALLTGAFVSPKCSVDFMKDVPKEIASTVGALRDRLEIGPHGEDAIDVAESAADNLRHRVEAAEAEVKRYRVALIAAKTRMRNCRGAIESDQVVDKDVHGSLQNGIRDIQEALASTGGEHNGN